VLTSTTNHLTGIYSKTTAIKCSGLVEEIIHSMSSY